MAKAENNRIRLPRFLSFPVISRWISPLASTDGFPPSGFPRWLSPTVFPLAASPDGFPLSSPAGFPWQISRWIPPTVSRWFPPGDFPLAFPAGFPRWISPDGFPGTGFPVEPAGG